MKTLWVFLKTYRNYWLVPLLVAAVLVILVIALTDSAPVESPFRYSIF